MASGVTRNGVCRMLLVRADDLWSRKIKSAIQLKDTHATTYDTGWLAAHFMGRHHCWRDFVSHRLPNYERVRYRYWRVARVAYVAEPNPGLRLRIRGLGHRDHRARGLRRLLLCWAVCPCVGMAAWLVIVGGYDVACRLRDGIFYW